MSKLVAVTAVYGTHHIPFVKVLVESLRRVGVARDDIAVMTADVPAEFAVWLHARSVNIRIRAPERLDGERPVKVARKLVAWCEALDAVKNGERVVFLDADTMVNKPLDAAFDHEFDVAYTTRPGRWPINSGVVFARMSADVRLFFKEWRDCTEWILADDEAYAVAVAHYGAADQASLAMTVVQPQHWGTSFKALPCSTWNDTTCANPKAAIWHMKGCLPLLLRERPYGPEYGDERKPEDCEPVFDVWRQIHASLQEGS